jgi:carbon monoxide dehydrogenase subunit G
MAHLGGSASTEINAPIDEVWKLVEDVEIAPDWQNGLESMVALERDAEGRASLCETSSDAKVKIIKTHVRFTYAGPTRLSWSQVKGDLAKLDGAWILEDLGEGRTRATYELDGDPGRVLGMLIRGPVEGYIKNMLVNGRPGELKARMEGGR